MRLVVVGGGVIGLSIAWRAAQRGADVTVVDPEPTRGASWVAGGMLAPTAEAQPGEEALLRLGLASAERWPAFVDELEAVSGTDAGMSRAGTLVVARDADEAADLGVLGALQERLGLAAERLTSREARRLEPALAPSVRGALWLPDDHQVDNRLLLAALVSAAGRAGVVYDRTVATTAGRHQVVLADGRGVEADEVVVATGAHALPLVGDDGAATCLPVRPVKGQILRVRATPGAVLPHRTVRGEGIYVIPRPHGEIAIGATSEERGFDTTVTAGAVLDLLRDAWELLPGLAEAELVEAIAGLRPGTPDNAPLLGRPRSGGPLVATGHHRNGVLLAPITADLLVGLALDGAVAGPDDELLAPLSPDRFAAVPA
ncbi:MAG: glycine oxidase ThiO [Acidimicrobiales bacterium]